MNTAIIGLGNIGARLAKNFTAGGMQVIIADRTPEKAQKLADELGNKVEVMAVEAAIKKADVIILAIYFDAEKQLIAESAALLQGKIVVDPSNPIGPDGKGGFKKIIPADQSSGQIIASLLPAGARFVKAFGTLTAESLGTAANRTPDRAVLFYATDDQAAGAAVAKLIEASGYAPVRAGGVAQSLRIEVGGDLHEMGGLGKTVSVKEASARL
ncbi:MAG: NADP oxidoreductase coenzyme F420-dependent [Nitrospira sp.]|nr:MAG: NADP oxidoreductase coenzyme F420-dependent [Nitrospira sp.]